MAAMPSTEVRDRARAALKRESAQELVKIIENLQAEHAALKLAFNTLVTKLNADATAQNALAAFPLTLDTNYAPAA